LFVLYNIIIIFMRSLVAFAVAAVAQAAVIDELEFAFIQYVAKFGKAYTTLEEYRSRFENFKAIDADIKIFNATEKHSRHAHNKFSDWSKEEFKRFNAYKPEPTNKPAPVHSSVSNAPTEVDWVSAGYVIAI